MKWIAVITTLLMCFTTGFCSNQFGTVHQFLNIELKMKVYVETHFQRRALNLNLLQRQLTKVISSRSAAATKDDYLDNPLAALVLVRRLSEDWAPLTVTFGQKSGLPPIRLGAIRWPTEVDVEVAARTVMRIQMTYALDTAELAEAVENVNNVMMNVTAADCFKVSKAYHARGFFTDAVTWLRQVLKKLDQGDSSESLQVALQYMATSLCHTGKIKDHQSALAEIFVRNPNTVIEANLESDLRRMTYYRDCARLFEAIEEEKSIDMYEGVNKEELEIHSRLCRSQGNVESGLRCRYVHYQQPHLRFQPFKLEELKLDPPVIRFHNVVTDAEFEGLRKDSAHDIRPAQLSDGEESDYRTSHVAWLDPGDSPTGDRLSRRIADMTQLDVLTAESHQLSRYGLGGEYLIHKDYLSPRVPYYDDRIATLMFYLSDVKQGGNTVFIDWELAVPPVKYSAILWFNYLRNGEADVRTRHSGCPTVKGIKWVCNKWFRNTGQMFKMPCGLHPNASYREYYLQ